MNTISGEKVTVYCVTCGKPFEVAKERKKQTKYCSGKCRYHANKKNGKNKHKREAFEGVDVTHYADIQKAKTLAMLPPIITKEDLKK